MGSAGVAPARVAHEAPSISRQAFRAQARACSAANWFFIIAAVAFVQLEFLVSRGHWHFVSALAIAPRLALTAQPLGALGYALTFMMGTALAGFFVYLGVLARQGRKSALFAGMLFYTLDGVMFLPLGDVLGILFHLVVLAGLYRGMFAASYADDLRLARYSE